MTTHATLKPGLRKRAALELFKIHRDREIRRHVLRYLFWECTLKCNLACAHCGSDCRRDDGMEDMPKEEFFAVLDEVSQRLNPEKVMICLTGGEPLVRGDLEECGRGITERGFSWGMVTNGYGMTEKRWQTLLSAGLRALTVSLDGLEDSHNRMRGKEASFSKALDTISMAAQCQGLSFDVASCITPDNYAELGDMRDLLIRTGVKKWRIFTVFPRGRAKSDEKLFLDDRQFQGVFEFLRKTREEKRILARYGCEGYLGALEGEVRDTPFFCHAGVTIASVLADGSVSGCPSIRTDFVQGNIRSDGFFGVWDKRFHVMRDRSWAKTGECADCSSWRFCQGNGMHLHENTEDGPMLCHMKKLSSVL